MLQLGNDSSGTTSTNTMRADYGGREMKEAIKSIVTSESAKNIAKQIGTEGAKKLVESVVNKINRSSKDRATKDEQLAEALEDVAELQLLVAELSRMLEETRAEVAAAKVEAAKPWWKKW